jgi:soluble lytic murein transglycosylase-like protein
VATIILTAAKTAHVSGTLLLAICQHESGGFKHNYNAHDRGSASIGSCQIKKTTAEMVGFRGTAQDLMGPRTNAKYAARYLKYQQNRYGDNWTMIAASYNSGTYHESTLYPGCPRNLKYIRFVQKRLPDELKDRLSCGSRN